MTNTCIRRENIDEVIYGPGNNWDGILENLKENNNMIIDNHNDNEKGIIGIGLLGNGHIVSFINHWGYCLNKIYLDSKDGRVHLSTMSVGGNMMNNDIERYNEDYETKIEKYIYFNK